MLALSPARYFSLLSRSAWCRQVLFRVDGEKLEAVACCPLMSPGSHAC